MADRMLTLNQKLYGEEEKPKKSKAKVKRYRAGQVPKWNIDSSDSDSDVDIRRRSDRNKDKKSIQLRVAREAKLEQRPVQEANIIRRKAEKSSVSSKVHEKPVKIDVSKLKVEPAITNDSSDSSDADVRRRRVRIHSDSDSDSFSASDVETPEKTVEKDDENSEESSESSEYSDSSDSDHYVPHVMLKPTFISKSQRITINEEKKALEDAKRLETELENVRIEQRKEEAQNLVVDTLLREEEEKNTKDVDSDEDNDIVTSDDSDDEVVIELWKERETSRVERDRTLLATYVKEMIENEEIRRRKKMTDEEVMKLRLRNGETTQSVEKPQMKFLQKYYHKGVYYQDGDVIDKELLNRDFTAATGDDQVDRTLLPKIMQVKNFGKVGRTKCMKLCHTPQFSRNRHTSHRGRHDSVPRQSVGGS